LPTETSSSELNGQRAGDTATQEFSLLDLFTVLAGSLRALVGWPILAGVLAFGATYLMRPTFTATGQILAPQQQQSTAAALLGSLGGLAGAGGALGGLKNPADQWVGLMKSRTVADGMLERFKLVERYEVEFRFEARKKLENNTRIIAGKDGLIDIEVDDHDPKTAADMVNAYIEELSKLSNGLAVTEAAQRRLFFERQLSQAKEGLVNAEIALRKSGISESVLKTNPAAAVAAIAQIAAQISATEVRLQVMQGSFAPGAPEVQQTQRELASLRRQLSQAEQADTGNGQAAGAEYVPRFREFKYYETLFDMMARQYELAKADEAREGAVIQIVDPAQVPEWKSKPKRATTALAAAFATLFVTLLVVLTRNAVHNIKRDPTRGPKWTRFSANLRLFRRRA